MKVENPVLLFICWEKRSIRYLKKAIRLAMEESFVDDLQWFFTTREIILETGFQTKTWQNVTLNE